MNHSVCVAGGIMAGAGLCMLSHRLLAWLVRCNRTVFVFLTALLTYVTATKIYFYIDFYDRFSHGDLTPHDIWIKTGHYFLPVLGIATALGLWCKLLSREPWLQSAAVAWSNIMAGASAYSLLDGKFIFWNGDDPNFETYYTAITAFFWAYLATVAINYLVTGLKSYRMRASLPPGLQEF